VCMPIGGSIPAALHEHLMLSFFAYGNTDEADENLSRVFRNITESCVLISQEMASHA